MWVLSFVCIVHAQEKPFVVSAEIASQHILSQTVPIYPPIAKSTKMQGKVILSVDITTEGKVTNIKVVSGHPFLVTAAMDAVRKWEYRPFTVDGNALTARTTVEVPFSLGLS